MTEKFQSFDATPYINGRVLTCLASIGLVYSIRWLIRPMHQMWRHYLRPKLNLKERYGGEWALITEARSGIGKALAHELAKSGFNVAIVSKNVSDVEDVASELMKKYEVRTQIIEFDFERLSDIDTVIELRDKIDAIEGDISILVNNSSCIGSEVQSHDGRISDMSDDVVFRVVHANLFS